MKSSFLKTLTLAVAAAPSSFAFSLYDIAPPVGVPESHAIEYRAYVSVGYDDNLNSSSTNEQDGIFTQFGVGASYSDQEAATRISYNVNLGARLYDKTAQGTDRKLFSESGFRAKLSHSFSPTSVYTTSVDMSFTTEPNLAYSISSPYEQGEYFRWSWNHAYSRAIDARWSWTANLGYSGILYSRSGYQDDDRQYLTGGLTFTYRYSSLTSYNISASYRHDMRDRGENSENIYLNLGVNHSLSPISSMYATVGVQCKLIASESNLYPNFRAGYRRSITEGLSADVYVSLDNENVGTGYSRDNMYLSEMSLRSGVRLNYVLTHKVSFHADASLLNRDYSKHTGGEADDSDTTWVLAAGMRYKFTGSLTGTLDYRYTTYKRDSGREYDRNRVSAGLIYTF